MLIWKVLERRVSVRRVGRCVDNEGQHRAGARRNSSTREDSVPGGTFGRRVGSRTAATRARAARAVSCPFLLRRSGRRRGRTLLGFLDGGKVGGGEPVDHTKSQNLIPHRKTRNLKKTYTAVLYCTWPGMHKSQITQHTNILVAHILCTREPGSRESQYFCVPGTAHRDRV